MTDHRYDLNILIGNVVCKLVVQEKGFHRKLCRTYRGFLSERNPDITVDLQLVDAFSREEITAARADGNFIKAEEDLAGIFHHPDTTGEDATVRLTMLKADFKHGVKHLNLVLPRAYYNATTGGSGRRSMLVHSCGIKRPSGVILFCGPSETGKTTVARFYRSDKEAVLNDEMLLVSLPDRPGSPALAGGTPIIGGIREKHNITAPLAAIVMLKQSRQTAFREIGRSDAYLRFMRQVIASWTFRPELNGTPELLASNADFCDALIASTPCFEMEFALDKKLFRKTVMNLEDMLTNRE